MRQYAIKYRVKRAGNLVEEEEDLIADTRLHAVQKFKDSNPFSDIISVKTTKIFTDDQIEKLKSLYGKIN